MMLRWFNPLFLLGALFGVLRHPKNWLKWLAVAFLDRSFDCLDWVIDKVEDGYYAVTPREYWPAWRREAP